MKNTVYWTLSARYKMCYWDKENISNGMSLYKKSSITEKKVIAKQIKVSIHLDNVFE